MNQKNQYKTFNFIGIKIQCLSYLDLYEFIINWLKSESSAHIAVMNAYCLALAHKDNFLSKIYTEANLIGPDGMPFVHWMNLFSNKKVNRFDATNLLIKLIEFSEELKYSFFLYGGEQNVLNKMVKNLKSQYPYIRIADYYSPPFRPLNKTEKENVIKRIKNSKAKIICVGLGTPKQDYWIYEHKHKIDGVLFLPCGAIFDFFGGRIKKAPKIISYIGFEWLYRLFSKDFKRLFYRYTILNMYFLFHLFLQITGIKKYDN
ncbi:MAG: hypothetical protein CMG60_00890 [Candidatus Marinimicrobia bacterium]|nr:hypothetical protein [Candidatus Neomarinimicrobiota bacterium]|tara:strand:+ start:3367 stop:4146 length:780 start_codon:yes stop_codon:yes gene_type:complete